MSENEEITDVKFLTADPTRFKPVSTPPRKESAYKKKMRMLREEEKEIQYSAIIIDDMADVLKDKALIVKDKALEIKDKVVPKETL
jgi:hypothetical protein